MKAALLLTVTAVTLAAAPALADNGQVFDASAQQQAYSSSGPWKTKRCFHERSIAAANRAGPDTLYVQSRKGPIYTMQLVGGCAALDSAERIALRSDGDYADCKSSAALIVRTPAGARQCRVANLRPLTASEGAVLSKAPRR